MNKTLNFKTFKTFLQLLLLVVSVFGFSQTPVTYVANPSNAEINSALQGNNVVISGGTLNFGSRADQIATFTGGVAAGLNMENGVYFGTGTLASDLSTNTVTNSSTSVGLGNFSDPDLITIDNTATRNVVSYSFTVTMGSKATVLYIAYQFGSEEYPDYVGSNYDDAFGFFVKGPGITGTINIAKLPNGSPISINKVNYGVPGFSSPATPVAAYDGTQSALYTNNGHPVTVVGGKLVQNNGTGAKPIAVQFNGMTWQIIYSVGGLTPGGTYTFKIAIADAGDNTMDSGVFINNIYATATLAANNDTYTIVSGSTSTTSVLNNDSVNGAAPASLSDVFLSQVSTTNTGVNLDPLTGKINVAAGTPAGTYTVTYQICDQTFTSNCKTATATITVQINDSDNDGIDNYYDLDDDNDGILDCDENGLNRPIAQIFELNGNASQISASEVQLTPASNNQAGQMWSYGKVDFTKNFRISFDAFLGNNDGGADGIAIVFHNDPAGINAIGVNGDGIGARGIQNGIVLELDTYTNSFDPGSPSGPDHGQIWRSSDQSAITTAISLPNLENGIWQPVIINWDASSQTLSYSVNGTAAGTYTGNIVTNFFGGANKVYFGYTASTGGLNNDQRVRFSSFCGLPIEIDTDNDGISNQFDVDSDNDGCADALEGSEFVRRTHIHSLSLPTTDANYPYRGQIKVTYNGTTTGTPAQIISTSTGANGVPQLVNVAGSNLNTTTNPSNLAGISDNTDGTADIGQNFGSSQNSFVRDPDCDRCFRPATTTGTTLPTKHGITALARAGGNTGEWPVRVNGAYTVLDAKTKGFVINRVPTSALTSITGVTGMMVYDTTVNCLKIYDGTSWNCYTKQTCNDSNP